MDRYLQTIWCDDIRHEMSGKISYIGVYSSILFVPSFPITLPKLCVSIMLATSVAKPFEKLNIRILRDDDSLQVVGVSQEQIADAKKAIEEIRQRLAWMEERIVQIEGKIQ